MVLDIAPHFLFFLKTAITWSKSSLIAVKSTNRGGKPFTLNASAARIAPSEQWHIFFIKTMRGEGKCLHFPQSLSSSCSGNLESLKECLIF